MRRRQLLAAGGSTFVLAAAGGALVLPERTEAAPPPRLLNDASWHTPDTAADAAWLAEGVVPGSGGPYADMVRQGLLDLRALTADSGAVAAGPAASWNYAWPRDSAFAAVALARTGHTEDATRILHFLADVQLDDGGFEARYLLDGDGTPDGRRRQDDGAGWTLWALREVLDADSSAASARDRAEELRLVLDAATEFVLSRTGDGDRLPEPSSDYWERRETKLTLGTAAPLVAGLRASAAVYSRLRERTRALSVDRCASRLDVAVRAHFARSGFARYAELDEPSGGVDAAVTFLLPPFTSHAEPAVLAAFDAYQAAALRPAGGLAPGSGWKRDGISWTPETALVAHAAASSGRPEQARAWLDWLNAHRTSWGAIPEKVLADGSPAGPAPLGWSAASVVMAVDAL